MFVQVLFDGFKRGLISLAQYDRLPLHINKPILLHCKNGSIGPFGEPITQTDSRALRRSFSRSASRLTAGVPFLREVVTRSIWCPKSDIYVDRPLPRNIQSTCPMIKPIQAKRVESAGRRESECRGWHPEEFGLHPLFVAGSFIRPLAGLREFHAAYDQPLP